MWEWVSELLTFAQLQCAVADADGDVGGAFELLALSLIFDGLQLFGAFLEPYRSTIGDPICIAKSPAVVYPFVGTVGDPYFLAEPLANFRPFLSSVGASYFITKLRAYFNPIASTVWIALGCSNFSAVTITVCKSLK